MRSIEIIEYYEKNVKKNSGEKEVDLLYQVGKTYLGEPINKDILMIIIESIRKNLDIQKDDTIIDLGCANGLITNHLSKYAKFIYGFDLSNTLIDIAQRNNREGNIKYKIQNILDIDFTNLPIQKIYMYEVLQHFEYRMLRLLLELLINTNQKFSFFIGSIPDAKEFFSFYSDDKRKKYFFTEVLEKEQFHIGNWWHKDHIILLCEELELDVEIIDHHDSLHTAHYRFDVLIKRT